jgi:hypothetical protein
MASEPAEDIWRVENGRSKKLCIASVSPIAGLIATRSFVSHHKRFRDITDSTLEGLA